LRRFLTFKSQSIVFFVSALYAGYRGIFVENYFPSIILTASLFPIFIIIFEGRSRLFQRYQRVGITYGLRDLLHYGTCFCFFLLGFNGLIIFRENFIPYNFFYKIFPVFAMFYSLAICLSMAKLDIKEFD
tara:strand:- start:1047 stop:1436 length:390 start_codon:yes stop_codon:yes gene_type:complete